MRLHIQKLRIILNSNIFLILIILLTIVKLTYSINNIKSKYDIKTSEIVGTVTDIKKDENKSTITIKAKENLLVYCYSDIDINLGDKIYVKGTLKEINNNTNFNLFNYKEYMLSKNIYYILNSSNIKIIEKNNNILYTMKSFIVNRINEFKNKDYLMLFILGENNISDDIKQSFSINGISHLFSISGMHITFLSSMILLFLNKIKKSNINYFIVILFLIFFMFLTNFTPSVIRATFLFIAITLKKILNIGLNTFRIIILILCFNLIINPYYIYNIGFQFSYTISIYLILCNKIINRYKNYFIKIFVTSCISFFASMPILINNFFSINLISILNNIIFVPFVSIVVFPLTFIVFIFPKLNFLYEIVINILENLSLLVSNFKIEIILKNMDIYITILYYIVISLILYKIYKRNYKYIILIVVILFIHSNINNIKNDQYVTFLDVGQGDSTFIHLPYNKGNVLIDTGGNFNYDISENIINYLKSNGIKRLDYLIFTHGDYDHMGEAINLVENFKVGKVIFNCGAYNDLENELIKVLDKKKIKYYSRIKELNIDNNKLYFLNNKDYGKENDNSSVIYTELNNHKFLFMGDAGIEVEEDLIAKYNLQDIDVLKVGHHGSKTSSSKTFIDEINPKYSIISVGKNNRYGHPNDNVLDNLEDSKIYRTDQDGSVMFKIKNDKLQIETCPP